MNAYFDAMRRYFDFKGRSTRRQFWIFTLVVILLGFLGLVIDTALSNSEGGPLIVTALLTLPHYIPALAAGVRRLHDTDRSGWWLLIGIVPLGQLVLLAFYCLQSTSGTNRFGPTPTPGRQHAAQQLYRGAQAAIAPSGSQTLDQLEKLASLKASGAIDEDEFRRMKSGMLNPTAE